MSCLDPNMYIYYSFGHLMTANGPVTMMFPKELMEVKDLTNDTSECL